MFTTLKKIRAHGPCIDGWSQLLRALGKAKADDEPVSILTILDSNGLEDALWCLRAVENEDKKIRLFAVWCARQVQHLMKDARSIKALDVAEAFAHGNATQLELDAAANSAWYAGDPTFAADWYAGSAAWYAALDTGASFAAAEEARAAARAAARDAGASFCFAAAWDTQTAELIRICKNV